MLPVTAPLSEDELAVLARAKGGDPQALATLFDTHAHAVYSVALNILRAPADAEDVLQDVFVGLPDALGRYDGRGSFAGWIKRVTVRVALMRLRRGRRRQHLALPEVRETDRHDDRIINRVALERALDQLSEKLRTTFVLRAIEGYSHEETARFLGISPAAVGLRMLRAKRELRRLLERDDDFASS